MKQDIINYFDGLNPVLDEQYSPLDFNFEVSDTQAGVDVHFTLSSKFDKLPTFGSTLSFTTSDDFDREDARRRITEVLDRNIVSFYLDTLKAVESNTINTTNLKPNGGMRA